MCENVSPIKSVVRQLYDMSDPREWRKSGSSKELDDNRKRPAGLLDDSYKTDSGLNSHQVLTSPSLVRSTDTIHEPRWNHGNIKVNDPEKFVGFLPVVLSPYLV